MEDRKNANAGMEFGRDMLPENWEGIRTAEEHWQRFTKTGSILDYLNYSAFSKQEQDKLLIK